MHTLAPSILKGWPQVVRACASLCTHAVVRISASVWMWHGIRLNSRVAAAGMITSPMTGACSRACARARVPGDARHIVLCCVVLRHAAVCSVLSHCIASRRVASRDTAWRACVRACVCGREHVQVRSWSLFCCCPIILCARSLTCAHTMHERADGRMHTMRGPARHSTA